MESGVPEQSEKSWARRPVLGGVLIGGSSTRMGRDKSLLSYRGETFVEHVIAVMRERTEQTVLLGEGRLPEAVAEEVRLPDVPGLSGPLAGILAALRWQPGACWIVVACDLPLLRVEALDWLLDQRGPDRCAVLPRIVSEWVEPLLAVYEPESLQPLEDLAAGGRRCPRQLEGHPAVHTPTVPEDLKACWTNVNTRDEYRRLQSSFRPRP